MAKSGNIPSFLALSCVGMAALASGAQAQDAQQGQALGGVTVTDTAIDDNGIKVEKPESPKYVRPLLDTPQTITVIGNQTIQKQNLLTLRDVLSTVPGITFGAGEGGGGYGDSINLRGQSANNDISIDGVRDSAQYSRTDPFNLEQIEVTNGANSVYGGSGAIGGNINLVTKRPKADSETLVQAGLGTSDYYRATIDSNVRVNDLIAVRLNAMYHENDVPARQVDRYERWGVAPSVKLGVDGPTSATLMYVHQEDKNTPLYGVPYYKNAFYDGALPGVPYSSYLGYPNVDKQDQTVDQATLIFDHQFSDTVSLRNLSRWQRVEQNLVVNPPQGGTYCLADGKTQLGVACAAGQVRGMYYPGGPRGNYRDSVNQSLYNQLDLTFDIPGGHTLVVGTSAMQEDYVLDTGNVLRNAGGALPNPTLNPIPIGVPTDYSGPVNPIRTGHQVGDTFNVAAYAFAAAKIIDQLELNGGVRYEHNRARFRSDTIATPAAGGAYTTGAKQDTSDNLFSYRIGLVFKPVENASLYAAYGNSLTPTSSSVRGGCGIASVDQVNLGLEPCGVDPQKAENFEIGGKIDLFDAKLQLTAALFRNKRTNYSVASNDPAIGNINVNDGRNKVDGITLGASGNITEAWSIFANYTYLKSKVLQSVSNFCLANPGASYTPTGATAAVTCPTYDPQAGNPLTNTPKHSGSLFTTYMLPFGLQLGYGLTYQGSFYLNNAQTTPTTILYKSDDYLVHRAMISYNFTDSLSAQLNIQNFTNEKYYTSIRNNGWANPGEGRSWVLTLGYKL
ncbi:TonB-dependent receptor [Sphingobium sp. AP49]|uniref:TonB-dependent receptor n=1 Tax=Sphingobium sp. AP49 TaxID=1144307 RepID=UPI00026EE116|nr:TonB-dependent receptor [Sphingobium sp. AP49]WHO37671.1 TonB-dependent receptor [Sphingobium sp. AP49]